MNYEQFKVMVKSRISLYEKQAKLSNFQKMFFDETIGEIKRELE